MPRLQWFRTEGTSIAGESPLAVNSQARRMITVLAAKGSSMEKGLCWGSFSVAGIMLLFFILDIILGIPFGGLSKVVDGLGIAASAILLYLSFETLRELR